MRGIKQHQKEESKHLSTVEKALTKSQEKSSKQKRTRIAGAPKRPTTAFFRWAATERDNIKTELGDSKPTEIMRRAGEIWKTVSDTVRAKFQAEYDAEKVAYDAAMAKLKAAAKTAPPAAAAAASSSKPKPKPKAAVVAPASPEGGVKRAHSASVASDADSGTDVDTSSVQDSAKKHKKKSKKSKSHKKHKKSKKSHGHDSE